MKIKKVIIKGFGLFNKSKKFNFADDKVNIIYGNNEAGKTTLLKGIGAGFFGLDKNRWSILKPHKESEKNTIEIFFNDRNTEFKLFRDFETNEVVLSRKNKDGIIENLFKGKAAPQSRSEEKEFYYDTLKKILGLNNETIFNNINIIYQKSIETKIDKEIQHIITGAVGTNYKSISDDWLKEYFNTTRQSSWADIRDKKNDREIEIIEKEFSELKSKKDSIIESNIKSSQLEEDLKEAEKEFEKFEQSRKKNLVEFELSKQYIDLIKEKSNCEERILDFNNEIEKYNKIKAELNVKDALINEKYSVYKDINDDMVLSIKNMDELKKELDLKTKELGNIKRDSQHIKSIVLGVNGIILASLVFFAKLKYKKEYLFYISIGIGVISLIYLFLSVFKEFKSKVNANAKVSSKNQDIKELKNKLSSVNEKIEKLPETDINEVFFNKYSEYKEIKEEVDKLNYTLSTVTNIDEYKQKKEDIEKELISINTDVRELEKENPGLKSLKNNKENSVKYVQELKDELTSVEEKHEELKNTVYELNKELASTFEESESIATMNYKINEMEEDLNKRYTYKAVYTLAIDTLNESIKEYQEEHIERLSKNISHFYSNITEGKHKQVTLTEDFNPLVQSFDSLNNQNLSCGAEDQLYFAVRLALLKEINDLSHLPLLLDDPFVNFDKERLDVVKGILNNIIEENQIILSTHILPYTKWDNIHLIKI